MTVNIFIIKYLGHIFYDGDFAPSYTHFYESAQSQFSQNQGRGAAAEDPHGSPVIRARVTRTVLGGCSRVTVSFCAALVNPV